VQVPFVTLEHSPLAGGAARIHYREYGEGMPLDFQHSGWGYHIFPIHKQLHALKEYRVIIPDRSGYGHSTKPAAFDTDFHVRAAKETLLLLDKLGVREAIFWGHSDGAVIAAFIGLMAPERCWGLILEAFHYFRRKSESRSFFESMISAPESFGERVCAVLANEHGNPYWRELLKQEGTAWLDIAKTAATGTEDLFDGRLGELNGPTFFLHGARDPRTDPGEFDAIQRALPSAEIRMIENGQHCPHNESAAAEAFTEDLLKVLALLSR
jgi:pimeloyl-ACP methyl ester carboxylesterase